jgi:hypothetical protein
MLLATLAGIDTKPTGKALHGIVQAHGLADRRWDSNGGFVGPP